jgi:Phosphate-selective porin O and P
MKRILWLAAASLPTLSLAETPDTLCAWLANKPGQVFVSKDNPWIQDVTFNTRFHWQTAWINGRSDDHHFWYDAQGEVRRFYFGPTIKFLNAFTLKTDISFADDRAYQGGDRDIQYYSLFEAYLTADLKQLLGLHEVDGLTLTYGKIEQRFTEEHATSSKDILTVERSMLDSYVLPGVPVPINPTGAIAEVKEGPHTTSAGIFSTASSRELSEWNQGFFYWFSYKYDFKKFSGMELSEAAVTLVENSTDGSDQQAVNYDWLATAWSRIGEGAWTARGTLLYGENRAGGERGGAFYGLDALGTYWLKKDRLQFVTRGEVAAAQEAQGLRLTSRYTRSAGLAENEDLPALADGRGDEHYSLYSGLNYYFCYPNVKAMTGIEWEQMQRSDTHSTVYDGVTYWLALRCYF